jgi:hypothetical protein
MTSENTAEQIDTTTAEADIVEPVKLSDLLEDFSEEKVIEEGAASGDTNKKAKPEMFNDLADSLGLELDDLYKLKVSTNDGQTVSIEELKSLQGTQDALTIRELEFEESRTAKEGDLRQAQSELAEVVAALPDGTLQPAVLEKLRAKNAARVQVEQSRTVDAIPTWNNDDIRMKDLTGMITHLERFGFPKDYLSSVVDHRQIVFIRESYLREQRIQNALAKVRVGKPNPTSKTKNVSSAPGRTARKPNPNARNGLESFFNNIT